MSLVAYDTSSDDESDCEDKSPQINVEVNTAVCKNSQLPLGHKVNNGSISDEDVDHISQEEDKDKSSINNFSKLLPKPKNNVGLTETQNNLTKPTFAALPTPKAVDTDPSIEEADDEFLHKKPNEKITEKSNNNIQIKKPAVKITIPSLRNFHDVEKEIADKAKNRNTINHSRTSVSSGLLSILPKAKSEQSYRKNFTCTENNASSDGFNKMKSMLTSFVPDSVKHKRPATNTEDIERLKPTKRNVHDQIKESITIQNNTKRDSDDSDDDNPSSDDFFSFNTDHNLPEVSDTEINALVAKRAAKIAETTANFIIKSSEPQKSHDQQEMPINEDDILPSRKRYHQEEQLNTEALQALVGGNTKRRRQKPSDIQVIDINSSQVMPNKDEWMRTALASATTYQPTGVLVDDEPASGTRRKHQITYLAHKAKANEAELQAMWSANRQTRRATQNKYGF